MRILLATLWIFAAPLSGLAAQPRAITLASTTSTANSGLFAHILPMFEAETGIQVRVLAVGTGLTLWGNQSLFDAVAVSGTASMFLTPVLVYGLLMRRALPLWSYLVAFVAALTGAALDFLRAADWAVVLLPEGHKYDQLLTICVAVLIVGFVAVIAGARSLAGRGTA